VSEIAGIPGRITVARERLRTLSEPEFGASYHLANVLLAAREKNREIRAAINLLFNERIERAMREVLKLEIYKFNRASLPSDATDKNLAVAWAVRKATNELGRTPDAVVDEGGYGVEPATYIFGSSAVDVADKSIRIARALAR
jgi:hydroxymethylpyrimidine/phosphomethylpyrimidine kinase